jgi:hypothetical protein
VARPVELSGLGVLDLTTFGYALRMRWEWLARTKPDRMWTSIPNKSERIVRAMFDVSTTVAVGNGSKTLFWEVSLAGRVVDCLLIQAVNKRVRKTRFVYEAMAGERWIGDISGSLSILALRQYVNLWVRLRLVELNGKSEDRFIWKWSQHSTASAYRTFFLGQCISCVYRMEF